MLTWYGNPVLRNLKFEARRRVEEVCQKGVELAKDSMKPAGGVIGENRSQPGEPPKEQTGSLKSSIEYEMDGYEAVGRMGTNDRVGSWMEFGTPQHLIRVRYATVLYDKYRKLCFGTVAEHPGVYPRPWLWPVVYQLRKLGRRIFKKI